MYTRDLQDTKEDLYFIDLLIHRDFLFLFVPIPHLFSFFLFCMCILPILTFKFQEEKDYRLSTDEKNVLFLALVPSYQ